MVTKTQIRWHLLVLCTFLLNVVAAHNVQFSNHYVKRAASGGNIRPSVRACNSFPQSNPVQPFRRDTTAQANLGHMAAIFTKKENGNGYQYICAGTIIEKRFILTGAHCVSHLGDKESFVAVGLSSLRNIDQATVKRVKATHIHPDYQFGINDIAILELANDLSFNSAVSPACLHTDRNIPENLSVGMWCDLAGGDLLKSYQEYLSDANCIRSFEGVQQFLTQNTFCTNGGNICIGASGVGLTKKVNEKNYVVGVLVLGKTVGGESVGPNVSTRVARYLEFIENIVWPRK